MKSVKWGVIPLAMVLAIGMPTTGHAGAGVDHIAIIVHMDPGAKPTPDELGTGDFNTDQAEDHWSDLTTLVGMADRYGVFLTLEFTPQWVDYILNHFLCNPLTRDTCEEQLAAWEVTGHEVAIHHHADNPLTPGAWDGYSDDGSTPIYGTTEDLHTLVSTLTSNDVLTLNAHYERPAGTIYGTGNDGSPSSNDLTSVPCASEDETNSNAAWFISNLGFPHRDSSFSSVANFDPLNWSGPIPNRVNYASHSGKVLGLTFHAGDYPSNSTEIDELFKYLGAVYVEAAADPSDSLVPTTVTDIMVAYGREDVPDTGALTTVNCGWVAYP
jgi:hypothetical protein